MLLAAARIRNFIFDYAVDDEDAPTSTHRYTAASSYREMSVLQFFSCNSTLKILSLSDLVNGLEHPLPALDVQFLERASGATHHTPLCRIPLTAWVYNSHTNCRLK